jgi:hypothetical protein
MKKMRRQPMKDRRPPQKSIEHHTHECMSDRTNKHYKKLLRGGPDLTVVGLASPQCDACTHKFTHPPFGGIDDKGMKICANTHTHTHTHTPKCTHTCMHSQTPPNPNPCTALPCTALHWPALHCTALHCTALNCTGPLYLSTPQK